MSSTPPTQPVQVHAKKAGMASATIIKFVVLGVVLLLILVFILQNTEEVHFDFLFWGFSVSLWIMFVITLVVGALLGMAVSAMLRVRKRKELKRRAKAV